MSVTHDSSVVDNFSVMNKSGGTHGKDEMVIVPRAKMATAKVIINIK